MTAAVSDSSLTWRYQGQVLLVDDDEIARAVGRRMLEKLGFEVTTACDGREAVAIFEQDTRRFRCVLLDLTMPVMDGEACFVELRRLHEAGKGVVGMKLIGQGDLRNSDEKRDESVRYVLGLGCVDALNVGFETIEEIDDFAARVRKVNR